MNNSNKSWPKIRERTAKYQTKSGEASKTYYVVDCGVVDGKRVTYTFKTKRQAEAKAEAVRKRHKKVGQLELKMKADQVRDAAAALRKLPEGAKLEHAADFFAAIPHPLRDDARRAAELTDGRAILTKAVEFYLRQAPEGKEITIEDWFEEYLERKERAGRSNAHLRDIRSYIGRFVEDFGEALLHEVTAEDIERWMNKRGLTNGAREDARGLLRNFWNTAIAREHAKRNPLKALEIEKADEKPPEILTAEQCEHLLNTAKEVAPKMVPYFAIAIFAGLRPSEIKGKPEDGIPSLAWNKVDFKDKVIDVDAGKTGSMRYVDMSDNLIAWLSKYRQPGGKVFYSRRAFEKVRKQAGLPWANSILRHTFGSHHLVTYHSTEKTILQMGNTKKAFFKHYRRKVKEAEAAKFWKIMPEREPANVVEFQAAS